MRGPPPGHTARVTGVLVMKRTGRCLLAAFIMLCPLLAAPAAWAAPGDLLWARTYNTVPPLTFAYPEMAVSSIGDVFMAATVERGAGLGKDWAVVRFSSSGAFKWIRYFGTTSDDILRGIAADRYGNVVLCGQRGRGTAGDSLFTTVKFKRDGTRLWTRQIDGSYSAGADSAADVVVDTSGGVYVTGEIVQSSSGRDFLTVRYTAAGRLVWQHRYSSTGKGRDRAFTLARDAAGNIYVSGDTRRVRSDDSTDQDLAVVRYRADGFRQWVFRFGAPGDHDELPADSAVRSSGLVVCGADWPREQGFIVKLGLNGKGGWRRVFNPINDFVTGSALLSCGIDDAGRVSVAGYTLTGDKSWGPDFAVRRYSATGDLLNSYGEPGSATEIAQGAAVAANGAVYATGHGPYDGVRHPRTLGWDAAWNPLFGPDGQVYTNQVQDISEAVAFGSGCIYVGGWAVDSMTSADGANLMLLKYAR